ncbi:MAG: chemotaxis protein CheD [Sulfitobacter sp.]
MAETFVITQGQHKVSGDSGASISTLLGSCVAGCLWDATAGVGGMNHILLATRVQKSLDDGNMAGVNAMELMINEMLKLGASRSRLQAKVFGGAQMIKGLSDIGPANCEFVLKYLECESIPCISQSLGGTMARHIVFTPATGGVRMKAQRTVVEEPVAAPAAPVGNELELF